MLLIYIASVLVCSAAVSHSKFSLVVPNTSVSAQLGSSVVLPCSLSPTLNTRTFELQWYKNKDSERTVLLYQDLSVQEIRRDARYKDRVSLIGELEKGDVSLELKNITVEDEGEYVCFVETISWYDRGSVNLVVTALGSPVVVSSADAGVLPSQILMVNVTCTSGGWSPKPTLTWRDSAGRDLQNDNTHYRTGLLPHWSPHKKAKPAVDSLKSLPPESLPLNAKWNTKQGLSSLSAAPEPTEERPAWQDRHKVSLTLDPSTAHKCLKVSRDGKSVSCEKPNSKSECKFPHVVSKEELGSGQHYWEVMIWDKTSRSKSKSSWCVGVTQKPHSENVLRALCYEEGTGLYTSTHDFNKIPIEYNMYKVGLHLNCDSHSISFYNADKPSHNHLHTFYNIPQGTYYALLSPGVKDEHPVRILNQD